MATSEAQKRASANYIKRNVIKKGVSFTPKDHDLVEWYESQGAFGTYVKRLIREDMERHQGKQ